MTFARFFVSLIWLHVRNAIVKKLSFGGIQVFYVNEKSKLEIKR